MHIVQSKSKVKIEKLSTCYDSVSLHSLKREGNHSSFNMNFCNPKTSTSNINTQFNKSTTSKMPTVEENIFFIPCYNKKYNANPLRTLHKGKLSIFHPWKVSIVGKAIVEEFQNSIHGNGHKGNILKWNLFLILPLPWGR